MLKLEKINIEEDMFDGDEKIEEEKPNVLEEPLGLLLLSRVINYVKFFFSGLHQLFFKSTQSNTSNSKAVIMGHRQRVCEELGPVYLLRSVRDQVQLFQEKRGYTPEENNFVNLMAIMVQQAGHAMYGVFTMFLALLPALNIFLHVCHFILDRLVDIVTTRKQADIIFKGSVFLLQLVAIFLAIRFVTASIFSPILYMQMTILSKMSFMDESSVGSC
ncbi:uncharacterized protein [Halyomorpha halys]|uniref:uncharacterized protein isoform X2 n=1 Tax=Halyomorpha halys TaxID=286706 RepID=UPI0006D4D6BF|nr:uncharacterized protein LOC106687716 isoform X2 [Halyomorpha halys]